MCVIAVVTCPALRAETPYMTLNTRVNTYDTTVIFWCDVGYQFQDATTARSIKCLANGEWSADLPECQRKICIHTLVSIAQQLSNETSFCYVAM